MANMKTITFKRYIVLRDRKRDFGLGPGILVTDVIKFEDKGRHGFNSPMFHVQIQKENEKFLNQHLKVEMEEVKTKRSKK